MNSTEPIIEKEYEQASIKIQNIIERYIFYIDNLIEQRLAELITMGCECGETANFMVCYQEPYKFMYILCDNCKKKHYIAAIEELQNEFQDMVTYDI